VVDATFDSATRFEEIKVQLKLDSKTNSFYYNGQLCALNSSLASNRVQDGGTIETCSNPLLSSALSAVLNDLNDIREIPAEERDEDLILVMTGGAAVGAATWTNDSIQKRTICMAMMKKILQRDERFFTEEPACFGENLHALYRWIEPVMNRNGTNTNGWNNKCNAFKPTTKKGQGGPSTGWLMLEHKLAAQRMKDASSPDPIETFVKRESDRHQKKQKAPAKESTAKCGACGMVGHSRRNYTAMTCSSWGSPEEQEWRRKSASRASSALHSPRPSVAGARQAGCKDCPHSNHASCMCLADGCPFLKVIHCEACFRADHPSGSVRGGHEMVRLEDPRATPVLKEKKRTERRDDYHPQVREMTTTV
jgi:hypothetical protein